MATTTDPLFDPAVVEDPHPYFGRLRADDPVHEIPGTGTFLVTRLDLVRSVVANPSVFSSTIAEFLHHRADGRSPGLLGPMGEPGLDVDLAASGAAVLATADPPDHTRQRRVVARSLSAGAARRLEPDFRQLVDRVLDEALPTGRIEWMGQLAEPLPMVVVARILGLPDEAAPRLKDQGYAAVEAIGGFASPEQRARLGSTILDVGPVVDAYAAAQSGAAQGGAAHDGAAHDGAAHDGASLIGVCAQAVAAGELSDTEALAILFMIVSAGGESTTSLLGTGVRILAERPDLQDRLRRHPELLPAFVEEACRIDPPFRGHYRRVTTDTELGGVHLPAGSTVVLVWPAANRDGDGLGDGFPRPDEIDLDRPNPRQHVGFGWGIHLCVGAPLARTEARVALERLLARTAAFALDPDAPPLRHHRSLMIRRLTALPLTLTPAPSPPPR